MRNLLVVFILFFMTGCGFKNTTYTELSPNFIPVNRYDKSVSLYTTGVTVVEENFYNEFEKALVDAIQKTGMFRAVTKDMADIHISAFIVNATYPFMGLSFDAKMEIAWIVKKGDAVVYRRSIITSSQQTRSGLMAADRLRSAINGAIRENIRLALTDISRLKL